MLEGGTIVSRQAGTYEIPRRFSGEDRYLKVFTKKGVIYFFAGLIIWFLLFKLFLFFGTGKVGFFIGFFVCGIAILLGTIRIPTEWYLYGGGMDIDILILRIVKRKIFGKVIYSKRLPKSRD